MSVCRREDDIDCKLVLGGEPIRVNTDRCCSSSWRAENRRTVLVDDQVLAGYEPERVDYPQAQGGKGSRETGHAYFVLLFARNNWLSCWFSLTPRVKDTWGKCGGLWLWEYFEEQGGEARFILSWAPPNTKPRNHEFRTQSRLSFCFRTRVAVDLRVILDHVQFLTSTGFETGKSESGLIRQGTYFSESLGSDWP